jgi:epoxyqueuosine reductase
MDTNQNIVQYLNTIGITAVGFCDAKPLSDYANFIVKQHQNNKQHEIYLEPSFEKTLKDTSWYSPENSLPTAKSIIVILLPYNMNCQPTHRGNHSQRGNVGKSKLSQASIFKDYHVLMFEKLNSLRNFITVNYECDSVTFCDFGPLNDKAVALKTGLVKLGRNSLLLHPTFGSRFYIGYVVTELDCNATSQASTQPHEEVVTQNLEPYHHPYCQQCGRCKASCPNQAIESFGYLKSSQCISFLTQSNEWTLEDATSLEQPINLSGYAYGCDICQLVCPLNGKSLEAYTYEAYVKEAISLEEIETMSQKEFKATYGATSVGWIGKKRLIRNIVLNKNLS